MRTILKRDPNKPGPLESYKMAGHCEMCGASDYKKQGSVIAGAHGSVGLEPAFNPSGQPKTLCRDCRIGSAELLADVRAKMLDVLKQVAARWDKDDEQDAPELGAAIRAAIAESTRDTQVLRVTAEELDIIKRVLTFAADFSEDYYTLFPGKAGYSDGNASTSRKQEHGEKVLQELRARIAG